MDKAVAQGGAPKAPAKEDGAAPAAGRSGTGQRNCLHKQLRKTKFCMFHLQGTCQFGKDCAFAHSLAEMNGTPDLRKTQLCKAFAEGRCDDPTCNFAHGEVELRSTDMFFKKSLCIWNEKGKCRNDSQCRFAHGLAELRSHQAGAQLAAQAAQQMQKNLQTSEETGFSLQPPPQPKAGRRRKGNNNKQNQNQQQNQMAGLCMDLPQVKLSSSNSSRSGGSSDSVANGGSSGMMSRQVSEPMKVQPQSVSPPQETMMGQQQPNFGLPDGAVGSLVAGVAEAQMQQLQRHWQDTLVNRLGALEEDYMALENARWQQQVNTLAAATGNRPDLQADLESLRKGIGMLAAQCSSIQQRMHTKSSKIPPYMVGSLLQNSSAGKAYPNSPDSVQQLLWQLQMQAEQ